MAALHGIPAIPRWNIKGDKLGFVQFRPRLDEWTYILSVARSPTEYDPEAMKAAITDWRAGVLTQPQISKRYGIPYKTLTRRLKGIGQDGIATTRALVAGAVAGLPNAELDAQVAATVGKGVALATDAMVTADEIFRGILKRVKTSIEDPDRSYQPKDLKDLGAAAKDAMEGVRRVRELDDPDAHKFDPFAFIKSNRENELGA